MFNIFTFLGLLIILGILFFSCQSKSSSKSTTNDSGVFTINGPKVYFKETEINGMDGATFRILDDYYARDAKSVLWYDTYRRSSDYFITKRIRYKIIGTSDPDQFSCLGYGYAKDALSLYHDGEKVEIRDLPSLRIINDLFYTDRFHVYLQGDKLDSVDGASFKLLDAHYAADKDHYYWIGIDANQRRHLTKIDCDYASFKPLEFPYATDAERVFYESKSIEGLNGSRFKMLGHHYSTDGVNVFYRNVKIKNADAGTFQVYTENDEFLEAYVLARDKSKVYIQEREHKNADVHSFVILNEKYNKDAKHVYYRDKAIPGADPVSFEVLPHTYGDMDAQDKSSSYFEGNRIGPRTNEH